MDINLRERFVELRKSILEKQFSRMNPEQLKAVFTVEGPVLILAGAGSGKTTVLVNRIANMVQYGDGYQSSHIPDYVGEDTIQMMEDYLSGREPDMGKIQHLLAENQVKPWNILAITFTNKAAGELKERLERMLGPDAADLQASTFHSACVRILRREIDKLGYARSFTIYDTDDSLRVIKDALKVLNLDDKKFTPRSVLAAISSAKDKMQTPEDLSNCAGEDYRAAIIGKIYGVYQKALVDANAVDFDDIITLTVRLFQEFPDVLKYYQNRFRYIMVDEYQDTNHAQYLLVSLLAKSHHNICVVGDDDQSIYKFRGANIENILNFEKQFKNAKVIRLEQNYRSTQTILDAANRVIENNTERKGKVLWTANGEGDPIQIYRANDEVEESRYIADTILENVHAGAKFSDHAILYRMNAQANAIEKALVRYAVPYRIIGGMRFYDRKEVKDVIAYLSVINNPGDNLRLRRIVNEPKRGIGEATMATAEEIAQTLGISLFEVLYTADQYAPLQKKSRVLMEFASTLKGFMDSLEETDLDTLFDELIEQTGYLSSFDTTTIEGRGRVENVNELRSSIVKYMDEADEPALSGFLEEIALYSDIDNYDPDADTVVMMTLHSAKGLEFPYVFITGVEEGIFPGMQSMYNPAEVEEERRLAYVGLTRAKRQLFITNAASRLMFGQTNRNRPSRFIGEIPPKLCRLEDQTVKLGQVEKRPYPAGGRRGVVATSTTIGVNLMEKEAQNQEFCLKIGDMVSHKVFGPGLIVAVTPMGNDHLVEVAFDKVGTKKIMANFAKLKKI